MSARACVVFHIHKILRTVSKHVLQQRCQNLKHIIAETTVVHPGKSTQNLKSLAINTNYAVKMPSAKRKQPNILITGTPGVGKSTLARQLAERTDLVWRDVSKLAVENKCLEEYDDVYKCPVLDEDKLLDSMENYMNEGGNIVDYHGADFFPERWFDIVFVLRTGNTILYDRLTARGYQGKKLEDNIDCEIFQTILEEAKGSYKEEIVFELESNNQEQMNDNVSRICAWLEQWKKDNP